MPEELTSEQRAQTIWRKKPPSNPGDLGDGSTIADLEAALAATRTVQG